MSETLETVDQSEYTKDQLLARYPSLKLIFARPDDPDKIEPIWQMETDKNGNQLVFIQMSNLKESLKSINVEELKGGTHRKEIFAISSPADKSGVVFKSAEEKIDLGMFYQQQKNGFDQGLPVAEPLAVVSDLTTGNNYLLEEKGSLYLDYFLDCYNKFRENGKTAPLSEAVHHLRKFVEKWEKVCPNELEPEKLAEHLLMVERDGKKSVVITDAFIDEITPERQEILKNLQGKFIDYVKKNVLQESLSAQSESTPLDESIVKQRHDIRTNLTALILSIDVLLDKGVQKRFLDTLAKNSQGTFEAINNQLNGYSNLLVEKDSSIKNQMPALLEKWRSLLVSIEQMISAVNMQSKEEELRKIKYLINVLEDSLSLRNH